MNNKYAFNCIGNIWQSGGGATVMRGILSNLPINKNRYVFVSKGVEISKNISGRSTVITLKTPKSRALQEFYNQCVMPFVLAHYKIKRLISLDSSLPLLFYGKKDLFYQDRMFHYVQLDTLFKRLKNKLGVMSLKKANSVYVASKDHKKDICQNIKGMDNKVKVVNLGYDFNMNDNQEQSIADMPQDPFFLFISVIRPYKNLHGLLEEYAKLYHQYGASVPNLYIIGGFPDGYHQIYEYKDKINKIMHDHSLENKVIFKGKQKFEIAQKYLKNTSCFIFPSLFEGFGLPILEAMANKVPVISSNVHSMPEVGGDTITYFDPRLDGDLYKKMEDVYLHGYSAKKLDSAYERAKKFKWQTTAEAVDNDHEFIC